MRLILSVFVCFFAGSFLMTAVGAMHEQVVPRLKVYALVGGSLFCMGITLSLLGRGWRPGQGLGRAAFLTGSFYLGLVLGSWATKLAGPSQPSVLQVIVSVVSLQGTFLLFTHPFLREHQTNWVKAFGLNVRWPHALGLGLLFACAAAPMAWGLQDLSGRVMHFVNLEPELQEVVQRLESGREDGSGLVLGLLSVLIVPAAEEIFFRGILYTWAKSAMRPWLALWGTSLLFAAVHGNLVGFIPLTLLAIGLAVLYDRTGNLAGPIAAHAGFNAANLLAFYLSERAMHA